jgi:hypothetical protein
VCSLTWHFCPDIDHLTRILVLCGTPAKETIAKITSEEVMALSCVWTKGSQTKQVESRRWSNFLYFLVRDNLIGLQATIFFCHQLFSWRIQEVRNNHVWGFVKFHSNLGISLFCIPWINPIYKCFSMFNHRISLYIFWEHPHVNSVWQQTADTYVAVVPCYASFYYCSLSFCCRRNYFTLATGLKFESYASYSTESFEVIWSACI